MKNQKKQKNKCCESCTNLIPIGEGDHICNADISKLVVSDYAPTNDYLWCGGKCYIEN